jgi:Flp pilus assembly protein TadG
VAFGAFMRRRICANRSGSVAAEFALITPLLSMLLLCTVEMGSLLYSYSAMQMAATVASRRMAVNRVSPTAANALVDQLVPGWAADSVSVLVTQSNPADPGLNNIVLQLSAQSDQMTPVALLTRMVPWTMNARVTIKQELPYVD